MANEELLKECIATNLNRWWKDHEKQIMFFDKVFNETCTMDQFGFIHDKATGKIIAGSKLDWFNQMLERK